MFRTVCFAVSLSALSLAGVAVAQEEVPVAEIKVSEVDFSNPKAVKALYSKLRFAALDVCDSETLGGHGKGQSDLECADAAVEQAVNALNQPTLNRYHAEKTGQGASQYAKAQEGDLASK